MCVRHTGDLRQMGDAEHLLVVCDEGNALGDHLRGAPADARVDLVKDHARPARVARGDNGLNSERNAREFATRGNLLDGLFRLAHICREEHAEAVRAATRVFLLGRDDDAEPRLRHAQPLQFALNLGRECRADFLPTRGQRFCRFPEAFTKRGNVPVELYHIGIVVIDALEFAADRGKALKYGGNAAAVFLFEAVDHVHARLYSVETRGIGVDRVQIVTHLVGCLLQGDVRLLDHCLRVRESIIIACNLIERAGNARKRREDGDALLSVLTEQIRCLAGVLDEALRMGKAADLRLEFLILTRTQLCLRNLLFLPAQEIQPLADVIDLLRAFFAQTRLFPPALIDFGVVREQSLQFLIPALEEAPLRVLAQERKILVLSVDVHEMRGELFEKGQRDMATVDKN